ncbi:hypothetical protein JTE90_017233 [Oedothorax gibbosus]|uniref:Nuclear pore complex protein Nup85 n=1 Tax=Oedothorax gibbosus TaxID=931172 RepID=A0AAV6VFI2_9ARAC|nr:hypothetical protein JTE90_017233 [Oedothorax gibbosus]
MVNVEAENISNSMAANSLDQPGISTLEINDPILSRGAQAAFSPNNGFITYGVQNGAKAKLPHEPPEYLHEISPKSALYNDYVRKLVHESSGIFLTLNTRICHMQDDTKKRNEIIKVSQRYRSVLVLCTNDLHSAKDEYDDEELTDLIEMFSDIELLWHLLQSLIVDTHSASRVLFKLLTWIKCHFVEVEKKREAILQEDEPYLHKDYWDTIIQFLLQGNVPSARSLLSLHRKSKREDFLSLDDLLRKMPMYGTGSGITLNEFRIRWKHWQEECKTRLGRGEFSSDINLETVCKILCGDHETLSEKSILCENWYHLMISVLLYTDPCISISALGDIARTYYKNVSYPSKNKSNLVDSIILAAMELDVINVINLACSFNDGWWFASHIMDLFMHGNFLESDSKDNFARRYRTFLLNNYADSLFSHGSMWQIGISYLDHCEVKREALEVYLERIPLKTEATARKLIFLAKSRNLDGLVKSIANVMTKKALSSGKLGTALTWVQHSKEVRFADEIADRWMKDYAKHREMKGLEIFKNMGSCMLISDKLTFIGKYCEFHKLHSQHELKSAASLLVSLIASKIAPPKFQALLLLDALPLLESSELILGRQDTYALMGCLEDALQHAKDIFTNADHESIIRLALVRNLARAFVLQTSDSDSEEDM